MARLNEMYKAEVAPALMKKFVHAAILSTTPIPSTTCPKAAYWASKWGESSCIMKNCEEAESGSLVRAIDKTPLLCFRSLAMYPLAMNSPRMALQGF